MQEVNLDRHTLNVSWPVCSCVPPPANWCYAILKLCMHTSERSDLLPSKLSLTVQAILGPCSINESTPLQCQWETRADFLYWLLRAAFKVKVQLFPAQTLFLHMFLMFDPF